MTVATPVERKELRKQLRQFAIDPVTFPGGDDDVEHPTSNCTACARIVVASFGGEIRGYAHKENSTAAVGQLEGGHDFAITPDRFLVDPWLFTYYGDEPVLDLTDRVDALAARVRYGPEENWGRLAPVV